MKAIKKVLKTVQIPSNTVRIYIPEEEHPRHTLITAIQINTNASNVNITVQNPRTGEVYTRNALIAPASFAFEEDLIQYIWPQATLNNKFIIFTFPKGRGAHPWYMYGLPSRELEIELNSSDENLERVEVVGYYTMHDVPILSPFIQYTTLTYVGIDARAKFVFVKPAFIATEVSGLATKVSELSGKLKASIYQDGVRTREDFKIPGEYLFFPDPAFVPEVLTIETIDPVPNNVTIKLHVFKLVTPSDIPTADRVPIRLESPIPFEESIVGREIE